MEYAVFKKERNFTKDTYESYIGVESLIICNLKETGEGQEDE
jgi:hypothetical protein